MLGALFGLALGFDGRGHHDLGLLELADVRVAGRGHRRAEGAEEVESSVVLVRGTHQDLLQRADLLRLYPRAARKLGMGSRHPTAIVAHRGLVGLVLWLYESIS